MHKKEHITYPNSFSLIYRTPKRRKKLDRTNETHIVIHNSLHVLQYNAFDTTLEQLLKADLIVRVVDQVREQVRRVVSVYNVRENEKDEVRRTPGEDVRVYGRDWK